MRVALVLAGLDAGGAEKVVNLLAHHRRDLGDIVCVFAVNATDCHSYFQFEPDIGLEALADGCRRRPAMAAVICRLGRLRSRLRRFAPDVVISFLTKINILAGFASMGAGWPLLVSERNNFSEQGMSMVWRWAMPVACSRASKMIMQTGAAWAALPERLRSRAVIIANPVADIPASGRGRARAVAAPVRLVAVGRLQAQKGFDLLLQGFARIVGQIPADVALTIFGEGPLRRELEQQADTLGIGPRVHFPGVSAPAAAWIEAGDVFVLSSRFEGFPNVLLEALAGGLASVAFDCPWGPGEILDTPDAGLLVRAGDVDALAAALRRVVVNEPLRQRLQENGPVVAQRYALPNIMARWDAVIADSLGALQGASHGLA